MNVSGVLEVDLVRAVDERGFLDGPEAARCVVRCSPVPSGAQVQLQIGSASCILGDLGEALGALRPAGAITVIGSNASGIRDLVRRLRVAFPGRVGS